MGRSVSYPYNAAAVTFEHLDIYDELDWEDALYDYRETLRNIFPSVTLCGRWIGREDHVVAENGHAEFGISEYGGLVSYWMVAKDDGDNPGLSEAWARNSAATFEAHTGSLRKVGSFSNGGGVYARADGAPVGPDQFDTNPITINGLLTDG